MFIFALAGCGVPAAGTDGGGVDTGTSTDADAPEGTNDGGSLVTGRHDVLFVGNSYVFVNDVAGHYRAIANALSPDVRVEEVTAGGYTLTRHAQDARTDGTPLARWLRTGTPEETSFDAVVLQEQSQIGGFPTTTADRIASVAAASELSALARARGAAVVLYLTWGYEHGDPTNTLLGFGSFTSMQDHLDEGYLNLAALLREQGSTVRVAPVGGAFRTVFEDVTQAGGDPLADGSDFDALYEADGSHPSLRGAYLAACVIAGTITAAGVRGFVDEPTLGPDLSGRLKDVCARTLADPRWHVPTIRRAEADLVGERAMASFFGATVAMSADGTRVLVGSSGSGRVFAGTAAGWVEEALPPDSQGRFVALSGDGARALAGPSRVYLRQGSTWAEEATLPPGPGTFVGSSTEFALSADGSRAIVGGSWDGGAGAGAVVSARVFVQSGGTWLEEEALPASAPSFWSAVSVALDGQGERAIVCDGMSRVFVRTGAAWVEEAILSPTGTHAAISGDGSRALLGPAGADRAVTFVRSGTSWTLETTLHGPWYSGFGASVALSADGRRALVGVPGDTPAATGEASGSARVYVLEGGAFRHEFLLVPRLPSEGIAPDHFGSSVALSADGTSAVVGAPDVDTADGLLYVGAAYTFTLP